MTTLEKVHYTPRELEIIKLFLMGFSRKEIGDILGISEETVKSHVRHLMDKTQMHCIVDFIVFLFTHGFSINEELTEVTFNGNVI